MLYYEVGGVDLSIYCTSETTVKTLHMVPKNLKDARLLQPGKCQKRRGDQMARILQQGKMTRN